MNNNEILVEVEHISKKFCKDLKHSLWYGVHDLRSELLGRNKNRCELRKDEFWAVKGVSFELKRGECLGLIGPNGAGKSTLLKMINGLIKPDIGKITVRGQVGALIELGAGFNPILTGRENVYVNASILGLSKRETDKKFNDIVDFAEIGDFIDTPVQNYSSGMKVRLGFAVAAQLDPDVLLLDEILAVGDAGFRAKCYDAIYSILRNAAVIFVSHNMAHINRMCKSVLLLERGVARSFSKPGDGVVAYFDASDRSRNAVGTQYSNGQATIEDLQVKGLTGIDDIYFGQPFEISFNLWLSPEIKSISINLNILSRDQTPVAFTRSKKGCIVNNGKRQFVRFVTPRLTLSPEIYSLGITIFDSEKLDQILWYHNVLSFKVHGETYFGAPVTLIGNWDTRNKVDY